MSFPPSNSSRGYPTTHSRASSQPTPTSAPVFRDRSSPSRVGPHYSAPHASFPPPKLSSTNPTPPGITFPPPGSPRRHGSEADEPNTHAALQSLYGLGHLPPSNMYPPYSGQPGISPQVGFPDAMPGPSPQPHTSRGYLPVMSVDDTFRHTASPDSQDGSVSSMYSGMSSAVPSGAPSHVHEHAPPAPATSTVTWPSERSHRRPGKSRRTEPPKDPRATNRLLDQRKSDDENIEALCKLFVPEGAEVKWKKDRLGMSAFSVSVVRGWWLTKFLQFSTTPPSW
ncbi:hypothetical protein BC827DRAFT_83059 [Russula dissimulans]|jgi:hypothetical protein|nr:hypothetical protein BC827DRAFT_83059 [Russula dissimulans]